MKILAVSTSSFTSTNREIYRRLKKRGINIQLVVPKYWDFGRGKIGADEKAIDDPNIAFLDSTNSHQRLYQLIGIETLIDEFRPDVIYLEGDPGSRMAVKLSGISRKINAKFFALSCENLSQNPLEVIKREGYRSFFSALVKYTLIKRSMKNTDTLFVINDDGLNYFKSLGFKKVIKTPLGFNEQTFRINKDARTNLRNELNIDDKTVVISYFGRIVYEKGVHTLVDSLSQLKEENWVFLIDEFGRYRTTYQEEIRQMIKKLGIEEKTIFFETDHTEIARYMNASDITVLASVPTQKWVEQYGRVVPEAMACGNLLVISNKGAQQEFFDKNYEYKFEAADVSSLTNLIKKAIKEHGAMDKEKESKRVLSSYGLNAQIEIFLKAIGQT